MICIQQDKIKRKKEKEEKKNALNSVKDEEKKKKEKKEMKKGVDSGCGRLNLQRFRGGARYACKKVWMDRYRAGKKAPKWRWCMTDREGEAGQVQILAAGGARGRRGKSRVLPLAELGGGGASPQSSRWRSSGGLCRSRGLERSFRENA